MWSRCLYSRDKANAQRLRHESSDLLGPWTAGWAETPSSGAGRRLLEALEAPGVLAGAIQHRFQGCDAGLARAAPSAKLSAPLQIGDAATPQKKQLRHSFRRVLQLSGLSHPRQWLRCAPFRSPSCTCPAAVAGNRGCPSSRVVNSSEPAS